MNIKTHFLLSCMFSMLFIMVSCDSDDDNGISSNNGHEYVNLGLSVKWATCNVGASKPSLFGNFYSWGATSDASADVPLDLDYGMKDIAGTKYDIAHNNWGGTWRMPTKKEMIELMECDWTLKTNNGNMGYEIKGKNGNKIFLPIATKGHEGEEGKYWTSTFFDGNDWTNGYSAYYLYFDYTHRNMSSDPLDWQHCVRPVCP